MRIEIRRRPSAALPVTMADLAFLLIVFLAMTLDPRLDMDVELPTFRYAVKTADQSSLTVSVERDGSVLLEGQQVALEALPTALIAARSASVVIVYADAEAQYGAIDRILAVLRQAERYRVVLAAELPP